MIHLREEILKQSKGFESWRIKYGFTDIPRYACNNLIDLIDNRVSLRPNERVIVPRLIYHPNSKKPNRLPISLKDETCEVEVWARHQAFNVEVGKWLIHSIADLYPGELLAYAVLRNGYMDTTIFSQGFDNRLYLSGFWNPRIKAQRTRLSELVSKVSNLIPEFGLPERLGVPVRI